jgi:hypothetical protein
MIPKGISHTSVQIPTNEFQKRNISSIQESISSNQNYQGLLFLPVTFTGLADLFPELGSILDMDSFVETLCISCDGPVAKYLHMMQGGQSSNPVYYVYYFLMMTSLGA